MAFIQDFAITRDGTVNIANFPRYSITARVEDFDSLTGLMITLADFTGANAMSFPGEMRNRTPEERDHILRTIATMLVEMKSGIFVVPLSVP